MWVHSDPNYEAIANQFASEYQKKTGVKVSLYFYAYSEGQAKITAAFAAHSTPDILQAVSSWLYAPKTTKLLTPVPKSITSTFKNITAPSLAPAKYNGTYYAVPFNDNIDVGPLFFYNKTMWAKDHVSPNFSSWGQYIKALQKLTVKSGSTVLTSGLSCYGAGDIGDMFLKYFLEDGGRLNPPGKITIDINNKYGREALQTVWNYYHKYDVDSTSDTAFEPVGNGTAAAIYMGTWYTALEKADFPSLKWGWAHEPLQPGQKTAFVSTDPWAWMVPKYSQHQKAAWAFIKFLNEPAQRLAMSLKTGEMPALKTLWKNPKVAKNPRWAPWIPYMKDQVAVEYQAPLDDYYVPLTNMVQSVILNQSSIPSALASTQKQVNASVTAAK